MSKVTGGAHDKAVWVKSRKWHVVWLFRGPFLLVIASVACVPGVQVSYAIRLCESPKSLPSICPANFFPCGYPTIRLTPSNTQTLLSAATPKLAIDLASSQFTMAAVQELSERLKSDAKIYIDPVAGKDDETADGTESKPFQSLYHALLQHLDKPAPTYLIKVAPKDGSSDGPTWEEPAKSAMKKALGRVDAYKKKLAKEEQSAKKEEAERQQRLKNLEESKKIVLMEDPSLPAAVRIKLNDKSIALGDETTKGTRVKVYGRIQNFTVHKHATFILLKDGYGTLQCVLPAGDLTKTYDALTFAQETALVLYGELKKVLEGKTAPDGRELQVDYYKVLGAAPSDLEAITNKVSRTQDAWEASLLDQRHLVLRGENAATVMKLREFVELSFIDVYREMSFRKVSPPAMVQTQVEGGATLFKYDYYGEEAYLTQSSQLYLETVIQSLGNVYCIEKSFRAERSLTRRHLSEYTHVEAEMDFIEFDDLLEHLEEIICRVVDKALTDESATGYIKTLNPGFQKPTRPFMRMKCRLVVFSVSKKGS